ncbi:unnamed protein product [marine sediment metagenome]|uniref:Uncharacterized protein n=1 Tax=marine sediment metagenome TaxID=412755 RepID=X1KXY2_9ZZZZ
MNRSGAPGIRAVDVWDVLVAAITTPASIGELLDDYALQFTPYSYGPSELADSTFYVPAAGAIVFHAFTDKAGGPTAADDWYFSLLGTTTYPTIDGFINSRAKSNCCINGIMYCDGVAGFGNYMGAQEAITLYGLMMS